MTTITAEIIADSISPDRCRLTTYQLRYPRFIHAEVMTHRVFSRNASSSRAVPVQRLIQDVLDDTAMPMFWGKNQKGMQAGAEHNDRVLLERMFTNGTDEWLQREEAWIEARNQAVRCARAFAEADYHKQIVNRVLEPFAHINVVLTGTNFANFFHLRDHSDAEPHIALLAQRMKEARDASTPKVLKLGEWHLPYILPEEESLTLSEQKVLSVARCASVSYKTVDGQPMTAERANDLFHKLITSEPLHASPAEHQATPDKLDRKHDGHAWWEEWRNPKEHGNLTGWRQFRKQLPREFMREDYDA